MNKKDELWKLCKKFISDNEIGHPEVVYQCDGVIANSYDLVKKIADIVGYYKYPDEGGNHVI